MNTHHSYCQIAPNIWRVTRWKENCENRKSLFVTEPDAPFQADPACACTEDAQGLLHFHLDGREVFSEADTPFTQGFAIGEKDGIYGLGLHQQQPLNRRNTVCQMVQINGKITAVPFMTSPAGYSVLFDTCSYMSIGIDKPCTTEYENAYDTDEAIPNRISVFADDADTFTYYVILGRTIDRQIAGYRLLTGKAPLYAKWTYGFFQCRERYKTQAEVLEIAHKFRDMHIPIDCIVQDWRYWGDHGWDAMEWDTNIYPDPAGMIRELHDMDIKLMISIWPSIGPDAHLCQDMKKIGGILDHQDRSKEKWGRIYDPYNPEAADLYWRYARDNLFSCGVDAWWMDSTEPSTDIDNSRSLLDCADCAMGSNRRYLNSYALQTTRSLYQRQRQTTEDKRVYILTRSGYAGQQASGTSTWTGDIGASWDVFKAQLSSLLGFSISGVPYSTTDIGAFFVRDYPEGNQNPEYRELYTRWFWFGAFSPLFRSHGTSTPREMWFFGEPGTEYFDGQMAASRMRYTLMPYIYAAAFDVYDRDQTLMRPLVMDFPQDPAVADITDTYLFGPSLLVHIVTDYQRRKADVYLPAGADWVDFYTGKRYQGGQTVTVDAPMDQTPLFAKAGSLILTADPAESTARQDGSKLKLRLYPGADCSAFCYLDDGDNYSYEQGNYAKIPFSWKEQTRTLTVGAPEGRDFSLPETLEIYVDGVLCKTVSYRGQAEEVTLD